MSLNRHEKCALSVIPASFDRVHDRVPWSRSDPLALKLILIGTGQGHDSVALRGDPASGVFSARQVRDGELVAVDTLNRRQNQMAARKLIAARARPNPDKRAGPRVPLEDGWRGRALRRGLRLSWCGASSFSAYSPETTGIRQR